MSNTILAEWRPVPGIESPCADISFSYVGGREGTLVLRLRFSQVIGNPAQDLLVTFQGAVGLRWMDECLSLNSLPVEIPKFGSGKWANWSFPLFIVKESKWAREQANHHPQGEGREHYVFLSMNDEVEVLAFPNAETKWVAAEGA
jgi:hypothetical protein